MAFEQMQKHIEYTLSALNAQTMHWQESYEALGSDGQSSGNNTVDDQKKHLKCATVELLSSPRGRAAATARPFRVSNFVARARVGKIEDCIVFSRTLRRRPVDCQNQKKLWQSRRHLTAY